MFDACWRDRSLVLHFEGREPSETELLRSCPFPVSVLQLKDVGGPIVVVDLQGVHMDLVVQCDGLDSN